MGNNQRKLLNLIFCLRHESVADQGTISSGKFSIFSMMYLLCNIRDITK